MTAIDWFIVVGLNALVFGFAAVWSLRTKSDVDWFLGGRSLPFWLVGMSMFATSVDGGEYIATNGVTYRDGVLLLGGLTLGIGVGGMIAAFVVVPTMYRARFFTNAEYLESRFGLPVRVISVLVQIQYRTAALATIVVALHLLLAEVTKLESASAWIVVTVVALGTTLFAAWGGLKTVAASDLLLGIIMLTATLALWFTISHEVGGWNGARQTLLEQEGAETTSTLLHIGVQAPGGSHPIVVVIGWILIVTGYFVVNHTQTMKLLGARSLWDLQMSVVVGVSLIMVSTYLSSTLGIFGRALMPGLSRPDEIYPRLVDQYLASGMKGLVVAGVLASAASTFQGITAALSALFTRDIYARLLVKEASGQHYLTVSRLATVLFVALSFAYVPFVLYSSSIVDFFVRITSVFVTPLLTVYLVGVMTRVDRRSALVGLVIGPVYGVAAIMFGGTDGSPGLLPTWFTERYTSFIWSTVITTLSILMTSAVLRRSPQKTPTTATTGWLARSRDPVDQVQSSNDVRDHQDTSWWQRPELWAAVALLVAGFQVFVVLW